VSSVPHECPRGRRCFDCHPRVGIEHTGELPAWMQRRVDDARSETLARAERLRAALEAYGCPRASATTLAPLLLTGLVRALDREGESGAVLDGFIDTLTRGA
jgi:hypothetical protein